MGLFDNIAGAISNPNMLASAGQLGGILNTVQELSNSEGLDASTTNTAMSVVGNYVKSALQEKRAESGEEAVKSIVNQFSGTTPNPAAVTSLFSPQQIGEIIGVISEKTGVDMSMIQNALPMLVPVVLNLLNSGSDSGNPIAGDNPVLSGFLDADGDGDVDIADAMKLAGGFLG